MTVQPPDTASVPVEHLISALNYIKHCGANAVMRGQPHPQQQIVDGLECALARFNSPDTAATQIEGTQEQTLEVPYLHASRKPLDEIDFTTAEENGQLSMFGNECEGMCGT